LLCLQAISSMLAQYGQQPSGLNLGGASGLDFGAGGGGGNAGLRAASAGSAFGSGEMPGMSQGFQQVRQQPMRQLFSFLTCMVSGRRCS